MFESIKITYLLIIVVVCFIGGASTILLKKFCNSSKSIFSYLNCLGGGIIIGASLLHLLKDSEEFLKYDYPYSNLIYTLGFFVSFVLERVLFEHSHDHEIIMPASLTTIEVTNGEENEELINEFEMDKDMDSHHHQHQHHQHQHGSISKKIKFPFMLFAVLSLESFISGMALAIEEDKILISITFMAIITHIWAEAFALHISVIKSYTISNDSNYISKKVLISAIIFSFMTPIGGVFGLIFEHIFTTNHIELISGILLAFAGGCFLYVSVFEIMNEEFSSHSHGHGHSSGNSKSIFKSKLIKLLLLSIGFIFMAAVAAFV